jgi:hypothetical protein
MEKKRFFFVLGVFVLLAVLLVPSAKSFAGKVTTGETNYETYQVLADSDSAGSGESMNTEDDEYKNEGEEEYKEEPEGMDEQYQTPPSDLEDEPSTEWPSHEEDLPSPDEGYDDVTGRLKK